MKFSLLVQSDVLVIRLYGLFNQRTTQKILKLLKQVRIHSFSKVTFDLTHVSKIDGSGLGILFLVAHQLKKIGGDTYALNPTPMVREQLVRADLPSMLQIFPTISKTRAA